MLQHIIVKPRGSPALTAFVRMKLQERRARGESLNEFGRMAGVSGSVPYKIANGEAGVGFKILPGITKALGYQSSATLIVDAEEYWQGLDDSARQMFSGSTDSGGDEMPAGCRDAITTIRMLGDVDDTDLDEAVRTFAGNPRLAKRSAKWWHNVLSAELDALREERLASEGRAEETHKRKLRAVKQLQ